MQLRNGMVDGLFYKNGWHTVGPGGGGGQFYPAISPHDDKHMTVFCDMQGTYMSRDGGKNWRTMSLRAGGSSACFDPVRPNVVYAGSTALYRSDDGGETWQVILPRPEEITGEYWAADEAMHTFTTTGNWVPGSIQDIALADKGQIAIAQGYATNPHGERVAGGMNVYYSPDDGQTWRNAAPLPKGLLFRRMVFDTAAAHPSLLVFTSEAVYRIDCRDMSFEEIPLPSGETDVNCACAGLDPKTGKTVMYIYTYDDKANEKRLFRSMDGGASWKKLDYGIPSTIGGFRNGKCIGCCPTDASVLYISINRKGKEFSFAPFFPEQGNYEGMKKSTDFGETWEWSIAIDYEFPDNFVQGWMEKHYGYEWPEPPCCVTVAPGNPDVCVYTTYGTSMRTDNGGKTWYPIYSDPQPDGSAQGRGLEVTTCYGVHFDPHKKENMMISYTDIGLFRSENGGLTWFHAIEGIPKDWRNTCYDICYDPDIPGKVWGGWGNPHDIPRAKLTYKDGFRKMQKRGYPKGGVSLSANNGITWATSNNGMSRNAVTTCLVLDPKSPAGRRTLYSTSWGTGVYRSDDDGATWALKNNGLPQEPLCWKIFLRSDGALLLINTWGVIDGKEIPGQIFISHDRAESWQALPMPEKTNFPNDMALDPRCPNTFYVAMWPYDVDGRGKHGGVYKTTDGGQTWMRLPLPSHVEYTYSITADQANPDTLYTVDFQQNCHRSDDGGQTWQRLGGYSVKWGHKAFPDPHNADMLYITTFGCSVHYGPARGNGQPYDDVLPIAGCVNKQV